MSAEMKQRAAPPPTIPQLRAAIEAREWELGDIRRENRLVRGSIPLHKASGDEVALDECRRMVAVTGKRIAELEALLEEDQATLVEAQARALNQFNGNRYKVLTDLATTMVKASKSLDEAITTFVVARAQARDAAAAFEGELSRCNVPSDAYLSHTTRLDGRIELALWAVSDGRFGRCRTMETAEQLRDSDRASLRAAAHEFREVCLQSARATLGVR